MFKKLITYGFGESVAKGINWLLLAALPLFVASTAEYGLIGLLVAAEGLGASILIAGQDRSVLRFYFHEEQKESFLASVYTLSFIVFLPVAGAIAIASIFVEDIGGIPVFPHLVLLSGCVLLFNLIKIYLSVLRVKEATRTYVLLRITYVSLKVSIVLIALQWLDGGSAYIWGLFIASSLVFVGLLPWLRKSVAGRVRVETLKKLWRFGWPFIFHIASGGILMFADRFMLEYFVDLSAVGIYTLAYSLGSAVAFIYGALAIYFEPVIYRKAKNEQAAEKLMGFYSLMGILLGAGWGILVLFLLPYLVDHVVGVEYASILAVTPIVLAAHVLMPVYHQANYRLTIHQQTKVLALGTLIAATCNILLNAVWIPQYGEQGAAFATFASYLILCIVVFTSSVRSIGFRWRSVQSLFALIFTLGSTIALVIVSDYSFSFIAFGALAVVTAVSLAKASPRMRYYLKGMV